MQFIPSGRIVSIFVMLFLSCFHIPSSAGAAELPGDKMAVVNGTVITRRDLDREIKVFKDRLAGQGNQISDSQLETVRSNILESLIEQELLLQNSRKQGITVMPEEIEEQYTAVINRYTSKEKFLEALKRIDLTEDELKQKISKVFAINLFINAQIADKIIVTEEEAKDYYGKNRFLFRQSAQVRASHILIKLDLNADKAKTEAAEKKIQMIQKKLEGGEDFAALAKQYSEGPSSARGGDLGYFSRGNMVKQFEEAAFSLNVNEVSDVVQTSFGLHLIKVFDKKPEENPNYEVVKEQIFVQLRKKKVQKELDEYVDKLKGEADIQRFL